VVISWVSFWIDRRAVPARVTLSFTTLLSLSTLGNGLRFGLPMVSYAKAIDYWFGSKFSIVYNLFKKYYSVYGVCFSDVIRIRLRELLYETSEQIRKAIKSFGEKTR